MNYGYNSHSNDDLVRTFDRILADESFKAKSSNPDIVREIDDLIMRNANSVINKLINIQKMNNGHIDSNILLSEAIALCKFAVDAARKSVRNIQHQGNMMNNPYGNPYNNNNNNFAGNNFSNPYNANTSNWGDKLTPSINMNNSYNTNVFTDRNKTIETIANPSSANKSYIQKTNPIVESKLKASTQYIENNSNKISLMTRFLSFKNEDSDNDNDMVKYINIKDFGIYNGLLDARKTILEFNPNISSFQNLFLFISYRQYEVLKGLDDSDQERFKPLFNAETKLDNYAASLNSLSIKTLPRINEMFIAPINSMLSLFGIIHDDRPNFKISIDNLYDLETIVNCEDGTFDEFIRYPDFLKRLNSIFQQTYASVFDVEEGGKLYKPETDIGHFIKSDKIRYRNKNGNITKQDFVHIDKNHNAYESIMNDLKKYLLFSRRKNLLIVNYIENGFMQDSNVWIVDNPHCYTHYICNDILTKCMDLDILIENKGQREVIKVGKTLSGKLIFRK